MTSPIAVLPLALAVFGAPARYPPSQPSPDILVSAEWLAAHLFDEEIVVLHVAHQRREYERGHIPGARFLLYRTIAHEVDGLAVELPPPAHLVTALSALGVQDGRRVVLYGEPMSAMRAWLTLDLLGLGDRAAVLDGGLGTWMRSGGTVTNEEPPAPKVGPLTIKPALWRLVSAEWVRERLADTAVALMDARPDDEFTGEDGGHGGAHLAGHIPGARQLHWRDLVRSEQDERLLPADQLRERFARAGAVPGRLVAVYCMIGMRASVSYFVARLLERDVRFYDGSWQDWSNRHLPVEAGRAPYRQTQDHQGGTR